MAEFFEALTQAHRDFIAKQPVFFVATAADDAGWSRWPCSSGAPTGC